MFVFFWDELCLMKLMMSLLSLLLSPCPVCPPSLPPSSPIIPPLFCRSSPPSPPLPPSPPSLFLLILPSTAGSRTERLNQSLDCERITHTHTHLNNLKPSCVPVPALQRVPGPWSVCLSGCVDECVGVPRHFSWDIERCVCHSAGGRAIGGRAPPASPSSSSSSSLCPSSPPHLRSLREPSTSPTTVSTPPPPPPPVPPSQHPHS